MVCTVMRALPLACVSTKTKGVPDCLTRSSVAPSDHRSFGLGLVGIRTRLARPRTCLFRSVSAGGVSMKHQVNPIPRKVASFAGSSRKLTGASFGVSASLAFHQVVSVC